MHVEWEVEFDDLLNEIRVEALAQRLEDVARDACITLAGVPLEVGLQFATDSERILLEPLLDPTTLASVTCCCCCYYY